MILTVNSRPVSSTTDSPWINQAACGDVDSSVFFPGRLEAFRYTEATVICAACPVRLNCLKSALTAEGTDDVRRRFGMYGGRTPSERAALANLDRVPA